VASSGMPSTISSANINQTFFFYINTSGTLTIPSASTYNQVINIRSLAGATSQIMSSSNIWPIGTGVFITPGSSPNYYTLSAYGSIVLHSDGATWYQIL
jgi:hypothetical protein